MNTRKKKGPGSSTGFSVSEKTPNWVGGADDPPGKKEALPLEEQARELRRQIQTADARRDNYEKMLRGISREDECAGEGTEK